MMFAATSPPGASRDRTSSRNSRVAKHAYELGVAGFFTKPFDPAAVADFVRDVIADVREKAVRPAPAGGHAF